MRCYNDAPTVLRLQVFVQSIYAGDMIRMNVRQDDFANCATTADQFIDAVGECFLLVFVRRSGIAL